MDDGKMCGAPAPGTCPLAAHEYGTHRCTAPPDDHPLGEFGLLRVVVHRCACLFEWTKIREAVQDGDDPADIEHVHNL